jgi:uncharacterized membrane protein YsdA (DUF1294 family)
MVWALYWLIAANLIGFILMIVDKQRAELGQWRIAESTLIVWSLIGGSIGTLTACIAIRHKTRKQPVATLLRAIPIGHAILASAWAAGWIDPAAISVR